MVFRYISCVLISYNLRYVFFILRNKWHMKLPRQWKRQEKIKIISCVWDKPISIDRQNLKTQNALCFRSVVFASLCPVRLFICAHTHKCWMGWLACSRMLCFAALKCTLIPNCNMVLEMESSLWVRDYICDFQCEFFYRAYPRLWSTSILHSAASVSWGTAFHNEIGFYCTFIVLQIKLHSVWKVIVLKKK